MTTRILASLFALSLALSPVARANTTPQPEPAALVKLQTMVTNLGYTTTLSDDKQHFYFDWPSSKYTYRIDLAVSTNGNLAYVYNYIDTFNPSELAKVPYVKIMEYQNSGNVFFSMDNTAQGEDFYANEAFDIAGITPASLRTHLEDLVSALDETDTLWNTKLWK